MREKNGPSLARFGLAARLPRADEREDVRTIAIVAQFRERAYFGKKDGTTKRADWAVRAHLTCVASRDVPNVAR